MKMPYKVKKKIQGAVSIFLVLIMVPMMTLSALFVDAGKVSLAKALAASAGDLTINTALTDYDTKLKDIYGLFATAQDTDELYENLEVYYRDCIVSAGVSETDADSYVDQIMAQLQLLGTDTRPADDVLNMELLDFEINKKPEYSLASPVILEKQIVEFMKYRAPIDMGSSFISALTSFKTLSDQTDLVDKRQKYYEEQKNVNQLLKDAWDYINEYNNSKLVKLDTSLDDNKNDYLEKLKAAYLSLEKDYQISGADEYFPVYSYSVTGNSNKAGFYALEHKYVRDFYTSSENYMSTNPWIYLDYSIGISGNTVSFTNYEGKTVSVPNNYTKDNPATVSDVTSKLKTYAQYINKALAKRDEIETIYSLTDEINRQNGFTQNSSAIYNFPNSMILNVYHLRLLDAYCSSQGTQYAATLQSAYHAFCEAQNAYDYLSKNDKEKLETKVELSTDYYRLDPESATRSDKLNTFGMSGTLKSVMETVTESFVQVMGHENHYISILRELANETQKYSAIDATAVSTFEAGLSAITSCAKEYWTVIDSDITYLTNAISKLEEAKAKLADGGALAKAKTEWSNAANKDSIASTSMAIQDKAELNQAESYLNVDDITKFITRLTNIKGKLQSLKTEMEKFKFGNKFVGDINGVTDFKAIIDANYPKDALKNLSKDYFDETTLNSLIDSNCSFTNGNIDISWAGKDNDNCPNLAFNKLNFYSYLYTHFHSDSEASGSKQEDKKNGENLYENIKSTGKSSADAASNTSGTSSETSGRNTDTSKCTVHDAANDEKEIAKAQGDSVLLPSAGKNSATKSIEKNTNVESTDSDESAASSTSDGLKSLLSDLVPAITNMAKDFRDKIYITDYIVNEFTYDTIEMEKIVSDTKAGKTPSGDLKLMTMTKEPITPSSNFAYRREVEYILYGGSNSGNVTAAYATIYGIRLAFNLIYAFSESTIRDTAFAIATPISAATLGIIPVPLIQAAIIIALACIESGLDIYDLSQGESVPLFKSQDTWNCSINGLINKAKNVAGDIVKKKANEIVDSAYDKFTEVLNMTDSEIEELIKGGTDDITKKVDDAYDSLITENVNSMIQKISTEVNCAIEEFSKYVNIGSSITIELENDSHKTMTDVVVEKVTAWGDANSTGSGMSSKVIKVATNWIRNNTDVVKTYIENMLSVKYSTSTSDVSGIITAALSVNADSDSITISGGIDVTSKVQEQVNAYIDSVGGKLMESVKAIRAGINNEINNASNEVIQAKNKLKSELETAASEGVDSFKAKLNDTIDGAFGSDSDPSGTGVASLLSFKYSDYMKLFLLVGLLANEESIMLRTADVIQTNMYCVTNSTYKLSNAVAYIELDASLSVKPTFLGMPLFSDVTKMPNYDTSWYSFEYSEMRGY